MDLNTLVGLSFSLYCICVVAAHGFAWRDRMGVSLGLLIAVIAIPVALFVVGQIDNSSHGNGYYGLDLGMMLIAPFVVLASIIFAISCLGIRTLGRRYRARAMAGGASPP
jgi:hypothetical protein